MMVDGRGAIKILPGDERLTVEVLPKKLDEEVALEMVRGFGGVVTQQIGRASCRERV